MNLANKWFHVEYFVLWTYIDMCYLNTKDPSITLVFSNTLIILFLFMICTAAAVTCATSPCVTGTCYDYGGSYVCQCPSNRGGRNCELDSSKYQHAWQNTTFPGNIIKMSLQHETVFKLILIYFCKTRLTLKIAKVFLQTRLFYV